MFTKEEVKKIINNKRLIRGVLTVEISLPLKKYSRENNRRLTTQDVIEAMSEEHEILEVIKTDQLLNWSKKGHSQTGVWKFKVKKIRKAPTPKKPIIEEKKEDPPKIEEEKVEVKKQEPLQTENKPSPPPKKNTKKTSKSTSFRGRIKKIATKK
tara:strand:- start:170 stop:631 length:462 start_codon:yes stop_codon:yes gene_type:complete